jgi:hypothetical protein
MLITIKGIRLETLNLERQKESNKIELKSASYSLISSLDKVLANQTIGGYSDKVSVIPSTTTINLLDQFIDSYKKDISIVLGLEEL